MSQTNRDEHPQFATHLFVSDVPNIPVLETDFLSLFFIFPRDPRDELKGEAHLCTPMSAPGQNATKMFIYSN